RRNGKWFAGCPDNDSGGMKLARVLLKGDVDLRLGVGVEFRILQVGNDPDHGADRRRRAPWNLNSPAHRVVAAEQIPRRALVDDGYLFSLGTGNPAALHQTH